MLYIDLETYSTKPITHGVYTYAENAEILCVAYAIDDEPVKVWDAQQPDAGLPDDLFAALNDPHQRITAHNSAFDRTVLSHQGYPTDLTRWRDTMVRALAHSLPGSLDELCTIFKIQQAKLQEGRALVHLFCKPRPARSLAPRATSVTHPSEWQALLGYAQRDVEAMRELSKVLPAWNDELPLWQLDQRINDRGYLIDSAFVRSANRSLQANKRALAQRANTLSEGTLDTTARRQAFLDHIYRAYGLRLPDAKQSTLKALLLDDLPFALRELILTRLAETTTSTAKYRALSHCVSSDGRLRGTLQFCGASRTGRWSGRLFQPQNLPRPSQSADAIENTIAATKVDGLHLVEADVASALSNALRGVIIAPPDSKLLVADLSNIESRVLAWLAGETTKLNNYASGGDIYREVYRATFGEPCDTAAKRQLGKVLELALGYGGGVGAFTTFAAGYAIDLTTLPVVEAYRPQARSLYDYLVAKGAAQQQHREELQASIAALGVVYENSTDYFQGLAKETWIALDTIKRAWRTANPATVALWADVELAVKAGTGSVRGLEIDTQNDWLRIRLPSGRYLCYYGMKNLTYQGVDQISRKWTTLRTYGGKLVENIVQAISRDVLAAAMLRLEAQGYKLILTIHDEVLTEVPDSANFTAERFSELLATPPAWAAGLPLAASGYECHRYRKG